jgi:hypothetical protein
MADPEGIWVKREAADCEAPQPALVIPGGSHPDWGPAAVNPGPRQSGQPAPAPTGSQPTPKSGSKHDGEAKQLRATLVPAKLGKALAKGFKARIEAPGAGTATASAKVKGRTIASGSQRVDGSGAAVVTIRFSQAVKASLDGIERLRLNLTVRFAPAGGGKAETRQLSVLLKR